MSSSYSAGLPDTLNLMNVYVGMTREVRAALLLRVDASLSVETTANAILTAVEH